MKMIQRTFAALISAMALAASMALSSLTYAAGPAVQLDTAPVNLGDQVSLQRGAKYFVNYCLNCHQAQFMRYKSLEGIGLTEAQIKQNFIFDPNGKVTDSMTSPLTAKDAKEWFGGVPPDLTLAGRSRGADWLYTYLRTYYRDDQSPTGWNNKVFANVGMPHVLHDLQGTQRAIYVEKDDHGKKVKVLNGFEMEKPGSMSPREYDVFVGDLVNYMTYMAEPSRANRTSIGVLVLFFLGVMYLVSLWLKNEYWKDVK
jgi:ubiquinol-cytochrome c reductase cytochrome c1 subunit